MGVRFVQCAPGVFPAFAGRNAALLDVRRGGRPWFATGTGARMLAELAAHDGDVATTAEVLVGMWPGAGADRVRVDFFGFCARLVDERLLVPAPCHRSWAVPERGQSPDPESRFVTVPARLRVAAPISTLAALMLLRGLGLHRTIRIVAAIHHRVTVPAGPEIAAAATATVRSAWRWWPGRAACAESSLAAVLALAACGQRAQWTLGVAFAPNTAHAWVAVSGTPVAEPTPDGWPWTPAITV